MAGGANPGAKDVLRTEVIAARQALPAEYRAKASLAMTAALRSLAVYQEAQSIFVYASTPDEVQLYDLMAAALQAGKTVTLPLITGPRQMEAVVLRSLKDLVPGRYGIKTVAPEKRRLFPAADIGLIIVPGAAFTADGQRLGLGGGFYDTFMAEKAPQAYRVALAYDCQLVESVPVEPHDMSVDMILTESKCLKVSDK